MITLRTFYKFLLNCLYHSKSMPLPEVHTILKVYHSMHKELLAKYKWSDNSLNVVLCNSYVNIITEGSLRAMSGPGVTYITGPCGFQNR